MVERKVGERFFVERTQLKVVLDEPGEYCQNCYFWRHRDLRKCECLKRHELIGGCTDEMRLDRQNVHFVEV